MYMCQTGSNMDLLICTVLSSSSNSATWVLRTNQVVYETRLQATYILISDSKSSFNNPKKMGIHSRMMKKKAERMRAQLTKKREPEDKGKPDLIKNPRCDTWETYSGSGLWLQYAV